MARDYAAPIGEFPAHLIRFRREARRHRPAPPKRGLVLEVGSGATPHPRTDVVVDKYAVDAFERDGAWMDLSRPLVVADGQRLPFADRSFAYTLALHVLEHATDPIAFAGELSRVAPAGFVQVPTRTAELTFGWPFHPWLIDCRGETLYFEPKGDQRAPCGPVFHRSFGESAIFRLWFGANRSHWHHSCEWRGRLGVQVEGESTAEQTAQVDVERTGWVLRGLHERGKLQPLPEAVRSALRCPACRGVMSFDECGLSCGQCGREYPLAGSVPILIEEGTCSDAS